MMKQGIAVKELKGTLKVCLFILHVYATFIYAPHAHRHPNKPEEDDWTPGTVVTGSWVQPTRCWEPNQSHLQQQQSAPNC